MPRQRLHRRRRLHRWAGVLSHERAAAPVTPFVITSVVRATDGSSLALTFNSQPGRTYAVDISTALTATGQPGGWQVLTGALASQGAQTNYADTTAGARSTTFYRVRDVTP